MSVARCRCGSEWQQRGNQTAHCSACHRTFGSERGFEDHRTGAFDPGPRVCVDPGTLTARDGAPRYTESVDSTGAPVWRSARKDPRWD